ncbi:YihY/virulence factor BrkB family protein [Amnibacterium flavum]|uniref:YihY/virulence factor BrkB family protein n=1 Tax=Amnibacterium flavum TaxID=2173173 RepID=UPI00140226DA|nr:YihY/virulence factor BrkB family protein [Amnibacterium flavum]
MPEEPQLEPDDPTKASWPTQIQGRTWKYLARRSLHGFVRNGALDAAGALTFFAVLSIFPAALAIVSLLGVIADGEAIVNRLLSLLDEVAPGPVVEVLRQPLDDIATTSSASLALAIGVLTGLWSASGYVSAFSRAMNRIYEVDEGRPYWKRKPLQLLLTVIIAGLVLVIAAIVTLSGPVARTLGRLMGIEGTPLAVWDVVKWPVLAAAALLIIALLYAATPNVRQPRFRWLSLGALVALLLLGGASAGFAFYVANFASYNQTFGALGGVIVFLIWIFLINLALLLGAEFNTELERGRQLQAGMRSESRLLLPARDTTASDTSSRTAAVDVRNGTLLRNGEEIPDRSDTLVPRTRRKLLDAWHRLKRRL